MRGGYPLIGIAATVLLLGGCAPGASANSDNDPAAVLLRYDWLGDIDQLKFAEPSGIVHHTGRNTLFVVGDEGDICEIRLDGEPVRRGVLERGADLEGVTFDPSTGRLYVAVEGREQILEVDPDGLAVLRRFTVPRSFGGRLRMNAAGNGLEAIAFVPDADHPEGGTFYVANQTFDLDSDDDVSAIFEVSVPLRSGRAEAGKATIVRELPMPMIDLAGLHHDGQRNILLVVSDAHNALAEVDLATGRVRRIWTMPGANQEGLAIDGEGLMYIAQDSGGILKVRPKWAGSARPVPTAGQAP